MKFQRLVIFFILVLSFISTSCRKSTLEITSPDASFFLGKMQDGNYGSDFNVSNGGKTITIGSGSSTTNYTFDSNIIGISGIYKNNNSNDYIAVLPAGDSMYTVTMNEEHKKALTEIVEVVGEENSSTVIKEILTNDKGLDAESITKNFPDKKDAVENIINKLNQNNNSSGFGTYKEYKKS